MIDNKVFFNWQARHLMKDYNAVYHNTEPNQREPKYFQDFEKIINDFHLTKTNLTYMKALHVVSLLSGFEKWADILNANDYQLELAKLLFKHRNETICGKSFVLGWKDYEADQLYGLDDKTKLEIFIHEFER